MELLTHAIFAARSVRLTENTIQNTVDKQLLILRAREILELKEKNRLLEDQLSAALCQLSTIAGKELQFLPLGEIVKVICKYFKMTKNDILGPFRSEGMVRPRHFAMYLCREHSIQSFTQIGTFFHRDHTTILHAAWKIEKLSREDPFACQQLLELGELIDLRLIELQSQVKMQFEAAK
jgi:chromosomal replication initiation ATPase DnaA